MAVGLNALAHSRHQCKPSKPAATMDNVEAREMAMQLARTDPGRALAVARGIRDPWYRCQALAWVGRYSDARTAEPALAEAAAAAAEGGDAFRRLTVLAWPIRAAIERGAGPRRALDRPCARRDRRGRAASISRRNAVVAVVRRVSGTAQPARQGHRRRARSLPARPVLACGKAVPNDGGDDCSGGPRSRQRAHRGHARRQGARAHRPPARRRRTRTAATVLLVAEPL
jgi:hypothetical protein